MSEVHCTGHVDYDPKKIVKVQITEKVTYLSEVEMTESEYKDWCDRIDNASGWEKESVGEELMDLCRLSRVMDGDYHDTQVEDFICKEFEENK
jgi:hypothetical protein